MEVSLKCNKLNKIKYVITVYGCNRLEDSNFNGVRRCDDLVKGKPTGEDYIKMIIEKLGGKPNGKV